MYTYVFFVFFNLEAPVGIGIPTFNNVSYLLPKKFFWDPGSSTYRRFKLEALERNRLRERRIVCKQNKWSKMFKRRQRFGHCFFCQQKKNNFLSVLPVPQFPVKFGGSIFQDSMIVGERFPEFLPGTLDHFVNSCFWFPS